MVFDEKGSEYLFHHLAEGGGGVCEPKVHEAKRGFECCLPPVFLFDVDVIVPPPYVEFGEVGLSLEVI